MPNDLSQRMAPSFEGLPLTRLDDAGVIKRHSIKALRGARAHFEFREGHCAGYHPSGGGHHAAAPGQGGRHRRRPQGRIAKNS